MSNCILVLVLELITYTFHDTIAGLANSVCKIGLWSKN